MSEVKGKIIEIFASQQWMKAADVLKTAKEKGIPPSTVFRWLKKMTQEGILEKQHESKKASSYRINPKKMPKALWEETVLKLEIDSLINAKVMEFAKIRELVKSQGDSEKELDKLTEFELTVAVFKELAQWLGALTLYSTLIAAKKGRESLLEIPAYYVTEGGADGFIRRHIAYSMVSKNDSTEEYIKKLQYYQHPLTVLEDKKEAQPVLTETKKVLEQVFGKEKIQQLEATFNKVLKEEKSNFKLGVKQES